MHQSSPNPKRSVEQLIKNFKKKSEKKLEGGFLENEYIELINHYEKKHLFEVAFEVNVTAIDDFPNSIPLHSRMVNLSIDNTAFKIAEEALVDLENLTPVNHTSNIMRLKIFIGKKYFKKASVIIADFKETPGLPDHILSDVYWAQGQVHESKGQYEQKYYCLREALLLNPKNARVLEDIQRTAEVSNHNQDCIVVHNQLLEKDAYAPRMWYNLGQSYTNENKVDDALEAYEMGYVLDEKFEQAYHEYIHLAVQTNEYDLAYDTIMKLKENFELGPDMNYLLGKCLFQREEYDRAKVILFSVITQERGFDEAYFLLAKCFIIKEDYTNAGFLLNRAIQFSTLREDYYALLGDVNVQEYKFNKALYNYGKAAECAPENSFYWTKYIRFMLKLGKVERAYETILEAEKACTGADLLFTKAACLFLQKKRDKALKVLENALIDHYDEHKVFFEVAPQSKEDKQIASMVKYYKLD